MTTMSGGGSPSPHGILSLLVHPQASADRRALISAVLIGSGIGLGLGAAYLAGGMARAATDHARASRLAQAAIGGFSESVLQRSGDPGILRIAHAYDPSEELIERERQATVLADRLERRADEDHPVPRAVLMRASYASPVAAPFHLAGALQSSRELECLTQAVYFEARGEGSAGQAAVAQVVLNRVRSPAFPKTVCGVVFQGAARSHGCQFSFACNGSMRRGREYAAWSRAQSVADQALSGAVMAAVGDATHFHTTGVAPSWGPNLLRVAQVGLHVFYRFGHAPSASYAQALPEMTAHPVAEAGADANGLVPELRLASAVVISGPSEGLAPLRGPVDAEVAPIAKAPTSAPKAELVKSEVSTPS